MNEINTLIKETPRALLPLLLCKDTTRRGLSVNLEANSHLILNPPVH